MKTRSATRVIWGILVSALMAAGSVALSAEPEKYANEDERRLAEEYLAKFPEADTDQDGVLTFDERLTYERKREKFEELKAFGDRVRLFEDVEFARMGEISLKLDLCMPKPQEPRTSPPLVVWIHGGGWRGGTKDRCLMRWLAGEGFAVASIQYRWSSQAKFPAQIHDCKGAIRWLKAHAAEYGYDPQRVAVAGESAGGHLALLVGLAGDVSRIEGETAGNLEESSRVQAVINFYGVTDLPGVVQERNHADATEAVELLLGGPLSQKMALAQLASPINHVTPSDPPVLTLHGDKDFKVPLTQARALDEACRKAGVESQMHVIADAGHTGPQFSDVQRRNLIRSFLRKHLR